MRIWGIGHRLIPFSALYAACMGYVTAVYPHYFRIAKLPEWVAVFCGVLLAVGVPFLAVSGITILRRFKEGRLITDGVFGYVRNPIYSAWIVFIIPALSLLTKSLLVMSTPLFSYLLFKRLIKREDLFLEQRYGEEYRKYRARVNEIVPWFRRL